VNDQLGAGQMPLQQTYTAAQPMIAVPPPSYDALSQLSF